MVILELEHLSIEKSSIIGMLVGALLTRDLESLLSSPFHIVIKFNMDGGIRRIPRLAGVGDIL